MKSTERKAARLVTSGRVVVALVECDEEENIVYVAGTVEGDSGVYDVSVSPSGSTCTCVFGENRPGTRHSHTIALQLAAWYDKQKETDE